MCRLLGVVAAEPAGLADLLEAEIHPFTSLAAVHCDGWGLSYWDDHDDLVTTKAPGTALSSQRYRQAIDGAGTDAAILHLRKASPNMANVVANTHPFGAGKVAFAHNGYFCPLGPVERLVEESGPRAYGGDTDSERYFALVLAEMRIHPPAEALHRAATQIAAMTDAVALNALMLTQDALHAIAFSDSYGVPTPDRDAAAWVLKYRVEDEKVIVASSGWDQNAPHWQTLADRSVLTVSRRDLRVSTHRSPAQLDLLPA